MSEAFKGKSDDLSYQKLKALAQEECQRRVALWARLQEIDNRQIVKGSLTSTEAQERSQVQEQLRRTDGVYAACTALLAQAYYRILETAATGGYIFVDLELNGCYLEVVELLKAHVKALGDCVEAFEPVVPHVLPGLDLDQYWEGVVQAEVGDFLSCVQQYEIANPVPEGQEDAPAIRLVRTLYKRVEGAVESHLARCRDMRGTIKAKFEGTREPFLKPRQAKWLVKTIDRLLEFVHVHEEQFLSEGGLKKMHTLGVRMNQLAVTLELTTPDRPVYYEYRAQHLEVPALPFGPLGNPTWPGYITERGNETGFLMNPSDVWTKQIHALRQRAKTIAAQEGGDEQEKPSADEAEWAVTDAAQDTVPDSAEATTNKEMREYDERQWKELEEAFRRGEVDPGHVNQAILFWCLGPKQYAVARLQGYPSEEEVEWRFNLSLETLARAAESHGLNSATIAKADHVLRKYGREALRILSETGQEMDALAPIVLNMNIFPPGKGPNPQERAQFERGLETIGRLNAVNGQQLMAAAAREARLAPEEKARSQKMPAGQVQPSLRPPETLLIGTIDELHQLFSNARPLAAGIRLGVLVVNLDKPFSSWQEEEAVAEQAWAAIPRGSDGGTSKATPPGPPTERFLYFVGLNAPAPGKPVLPHWADCHWLGRIGLWGGDSDVRWGLWKKSFEGAANRLIPALKVTAQSRHFYGKWNSLYMRLTAFPLMELVYDRDGHPEGAVHLAWETLLATIGMMEGSPIHGHEFEIDALGESARCWYFELQPREASLVALRYLTYYSTAPLSAGDFGLADGAVTFADLARLIELVDDRQRREGWTREIDDLVDCVRASARALRPLGNSLLGDTLYEEFLSELQTTVTFKEVDSGTEYGSAVLWGGTDSQMKALVQKLKEWDERDRKMRQASQAPSTQRPAGEKPTPPYQFKIVGEVWHVRFGNEYGEIINRVGMVRILSLLLQPNPGEAITALKLCGVDEPGIEEKHASHQQVLDARSRREFSDSLAELNADIEEANNSENLVEVERLTADREAILKELRKNRRSRRKGKELGPKDAREKAAEAVARSLKTVFNTMRLKGLPKLADHLDSAIKTESYSFAYRPGPTPHNWHF